MKLCCRMLIAYTKFEKAIASVIFVCESKPDSREDIYPIMKLRTSKSKVQSKKRTPALCKCVDVYIEDMSDVS